MLTHIGRYEIEYLIGRGGMGELYLARDPNTSRLVALKLLNTSLDSADLRDRFDREARALAALNHPNIVDIYDCGEFERSPYIVMEYVRGETLAEKIRRRAPLSLPEKLRLMAELCAGLAHAHEAGIIHRDIKPANLMVDPEGRLKILDFGIARVTEGSLTRLQLTQINVRIGTPGYMSPEQIEGREIDARSDLFAVGAVCYELLSNHVAFPGATTRQVEDKVLEAQPVPLQSLARETHPEIDAELEEVVNRALVKDRDRRYQDAATMGEEFERHRLRFRSSTTPAPAVRVTPKPGAGHRTRAEAAYLRAISVLKDGASEAARRYAIETLAEDPGHAAARFLLSTLEPEPWAIRPARTLPQGFSPTVSHDVGAVGATRPATPGGIAPGGATAEAETILKPPPRRRPRATGNQYRWVALAAGIAVIAAGTLVLALLLTGRLSASEILTIERPVGGTVFARGIRCGSLGGDCAESFAREQPVELEAQPDAGFVFSGYTGDCAQAGRTTMSRARRCGATFSPIPSAASQRATTTLRRLTMDRPAGGTILTEGIKCGTLGNDCSEEFPEGTQVALHALADAGYSSSARYTGPCAPRGETTMTEDRVCGATFVPRPVIAPGSAPGSPGRARAGRETPGGPASGGRESIVPSPALATAGNASQPPAEERAEPPIPPEKQARNAIQETLVRYCTAVESLDFDRIRAVHPAAPDNIRHQMKDYAAVQCTITSEPAYRSLDAVAGTASASVAMRRIFHMRVGGPKRVSETTAVLTLRRPQPRSDWLIDTLSFAPKQ